MKKASPKKKLDVMLPISMRVARPQYKSLLRLRIKTGIPVQEHVRRAVDLYVRKMERANAAQAH